MRNTVAKCPNCGARVKATVNWDERMPNGKLGWHVKCYNCQLKATTVPTEGEAIREWNSMVSEIAAAKKKPGRNLQECLF